MLDIVNIFLSKGQQLRGIFMIGNGFDINALDEEKLPAEEAQIGDQSDKANRNDNGKQISVNVGYWSENDDKDKHAYWSQCQQKHYQEHQFILLQFL